MNSNYKEGSCFGLPLRNGGFAIGVVARAKGNGCILAYFFGPKRKKIPNINEVSELSANAAILVLRVGDLGLINKAWPIIGDIQSFNYLDWPMPIFIRRDPLNPTRQWRVYYSENDPSVRIKEEIEQDQRLDLPTDSLSGYGSAEIKLTKLLG